MKHHGSERLHDHERLELYRDLVQSSLAIASRAAFGSG